MSKLSTERAIDALDTVKAYYASLTAGYPKGKDCKAIGDVMCSEIANSCLMAIKALRQEPFINKPCVSSGVCEYDKNKILDRIRAEIEQLPTNTKTNWDGCCPDIDYPEIEYVDVTKKQLLYIIDKYRAKSEE